ncbi:centromere/kinetochore protein zw10 homolog isoform X2 [Tripterygium wilfordii]|nr:centromere/kinetochore protein zw10 homolog isoform X2 [Tripterygium wilfordii]
MKEARMKRELLDLVKVILEFSERLRGAKEAVKNGRLIFAAEELRVLKKGLRIGDEEEKEPIVYGLLRKEWIDCFEEIQEKLVRLMEHGVRFEPALNRVHVQYQLSVEGIHGVELRTVLEAMEVVGILDYGLARVADQIIKFVIVPVVKYGSPVSVGEEVKTGLRGTSEANLNVQPSPEAEIGNVDGDTIYSGIIQIVKFIHKCICFQNGSWVRCFGKLTWPRISELIISHFLSKVVPEDALKLTDFQKIIECTSEFESALSEMMFISASDCGEKKLTNFAENVEVHFASRKKTEILAKVRSLLLQCDFTIPQDHMSKVPVLKNGEKAANSSELVDLLFLSERCVVSKAASQLMQLVHQTLKDVCLSSPRVALELYRAARDAILLYEAVIPVKLERQLDDINQVAVLMHNDCLYLSQEILGLAFEYRADFPSSIKEHVVFVDMAPSFHLMAKEILQRQIQRVIYNLNEAIDGADGFQNTHQMKQFQSAKFSIDQVVFILEKVRIIWEQLLLPSTYKYGMCAVLETVFSRIAREILLLDDMAADETLQLQRLIHLMLDNLSFLIESLNVAKERGDSVEECLGPLDGLIPSLHKIHKLAELLDMPLKSITSAWESGELRSAGFTASEVEDFIKAIFTDSSLRKECLWRIENISL